MKKLLLMLLATVSLIACHSDGGGKNPLPTDPDATHIIYADEIGHTSSTKMAI